VPRTPELRRSHEPPGPNERLLALRALPEGSESLPALLAAARDPSAPIAQEALHRLAASGGEEEEAALRTRVWSVDPAVLDDTVNAIARIAVRLGDRSAIDEALAQLDSAQYAARLAAVALLGALSDPAAEPALRRALEDPVAAVRRRALDALSTTATRARRGSRATPETGEAIAASLVDRNPAVRAMAITALAHLPGASREPLAALTEDPDLHVRRTLASVAARLPADPARRLLADRDDHVRELAAANAGAQAGEGLRMALREDERPAVRRAAARRLGELHARDATEDLLDALGDGDAQVRVLALDSLGSAHGSEATLALLSAALSDRGRHNRPALLYALGRLEPRGARSLLMPLTEDSDPALRLALAHVAGDLGEPLVLGALREDPDPGVTHAAAVVARRMTGKG
jgi:HEAT repeat protein